jgi:hypothetical protein
MVEPAYMACAVPAAMVQCMLTDEAFLCLRWFCCPGIAAQQRYEQQEQQEQF